MTPVLFGLAMAVGAEFAAVVELMRLVARAVGRPVFAASEGFGQAGAFLSVSSEWAATYLPPRRGWFARWLTGAGS
jgi:hypothetical protein